MAAVGGVFAAALVAGACGSSSSHSSTATSTGSVGSTSGGASGAPYTISYVGDLTGGNSQNGEPALAAAEGAVWAINQAGGVNGHPLKITTVQDAQSTTTGAEAAVRSALGSKTNLTTGGMGGSSVAATATVYNSAGIPSISVSYPIESVVSSPEWFTLAPTGSQVAAGAVNGLKGILGGSLAGKTIGFEGLDVPTVDNNLAAIKTLVQQDGGKMGPVIRDPLTFTSWSSQAAQVAAAHVDGFIVNHDESSTAIVAKALITAGVKAPIVSTEGASSDTLFQTVDASNFYAVRETSEASVAEGSVPADAAKSAGYGSASPLNPYFGRMWGIIYIAADAFKKCGYPCSGSSFESALESLGTVQIPNSVYLGPIQFSSSGHAGLTTAQIYTWDAGKGTAMPSGSSFSINS
jgi:branched-chain amino acid transport system substrate-binding protein